MSGSVTPNFRLLKPPFDGIPWDQAVNGNMDIIDAALAQYLTVANFVGVWKNSTAYAPGQVAIDPVDSTFWRCLIAHTSAASPSTFAQDRATLVGRWTPTVPSGTNNAGSGNVGRNLVRNSRFLIQQRGAGPFNINAPATTIVMYTADGWRYNGAFDTVTIQTPVMSDAIRQQIGDESGKNYLTVAFTGSANANAFSVISQTMEFVHHLAGKTVTVSFWAASSTAIKLAISFTQYFGPGGSQGVNTPAQVITMTGVHTRYSLTFTIPSVIGKTLGSAGGLPIDCTIFQIACSSGSVSNATFGNIGVQSGFFNLWGVQVEVGTSATALELPELTTEVSRCQRYFTQFTQLLCSSGYVNQAGSNVWMDISHPVYMRVRPVITFSNIAYSNASGLAVNSSTETNSRYIITSGAAGSCFAIFDAQLSSEI